MWIRQEYFPIIDSQQTGYHLNLIFSCNFLPRFSDILSIRSTLQYIWDVFFAVSFKFLLTLKSFKYFSLDNKMRNIQVLTQLDGSVHVWRDITVLMQKYSHMCKNKRGGREGIFARRKTQFACILCEHKIKLYESTKRVLIESSVKIIYNPIRLTPTLAKSHLGDTGSGIISKHHIIPRP